MTVWNQTKNIGE